MIISLERIYSNRNFWEANNSNYTYSFVVLQIQNLLFSYDIFYYSFNLIPLSKVFSYNIMKRFLFFKSKPGELLAKNDRQKLPFFLQQNWTKYLNTVSLFVKAFPHYKWNRKRFLLAESERTSCRTSCWTT